MAEERSGTNMKDLMAKFQKKSDYVPTPQSFSSTQKQGTSATGTREFKASSVPSATSQPPGDMYSFLPTPWRKTSPSNKSPTSSSQSKQDAQASLPASHPYFTQNSEKNYITPIATSSSDDTKTVAQAISPRHDHQASTSASESGPSASPSSSQGPPASLSNNSETANPLMAMKQRGASSAGSGSMPASLSNNSEFANPLLAMKQRAASKPSES